MGWKKEPNVADLTPTAVIVALERDLLLSSLSRPVGSVRGIPSPAAVPKKAPADARAAAEVIALIRRGEFVAALTCPAAKEALIVPAALEGQPAPSPDVDGVSALYASVEAAVESAGAAAAQAGALPKAAHELVILAIGVAALNAFIQANVTGPDCRDAPHCPLTPSASAADLETSAPAWNKWAVKSLTEDGEDLVGRCFLPQYLYLARALLGKRCATRTKEAVGGDDVDVAVATLAETRARAARKQSTSSSGGRVVMWPDENVQPPSLTWWASRAAIAHQRLLSGRSPTLRGQLLGYHALTLCWYVYLGTHILIIARTIRLSNSCFIHRYAPNNAAPGFPSAAAVVKAAGAREASDGSPTPSAAAAAVAGLLASMSLLETALMEHEYGHVDSAKALLRAAGEPIGASHEIVGEMGFRTVHQTDAKAQMVLRAECRGLEMFKRPVVNGPLGGEREETTASDDETDELLAEEAAEAAAKRARGNRGTGRDWPRRQHQISRHEPHRHRTRRVIRRRSSGAHRAEARRHTRGPRRGGYRHEDAATGGAPGAGAGVGGDRAQVHGGRRHSFVVRGAVSRVRSDAGAVPAGATGGGGGARVQARA